MIRNKNDTHLGMVVTPTPLDQWDTEQLREELGERLAEALMYALDNYQSQAAIEYLNDIMGGHGVEPLRDEAYYDPYWQNTIAEYVNMGDTYKPTIIYDTEHGRFYYMSWGDFYEWWKSEHAEENIEVMEPGEYEADVNSLLRQVAAEVPAVVRDVFVRYYLGRKFPLDKTYMEEWAQRFIEGTEWNRSDMEGQRLLKELDSAQYGSLMPGIPGMRVGKALGEMFGKPASTSQSHSPLDTNLNIKEVMERIHFRKLAMILRPLMDEVSRHGEVLQIPVPGHPPYTTYEVNDAIVNTVGHDYYEIPIITGDTSGDFMFVNPDTQDVIYYELLDGRLQHGGVRHKVAPTYWGLAAKVLDGNVEGLEWEIREYKPYVPIRERSETDKYAETGAEWGQIASKFKEMSDEELLGATEYHNLLQQVRKLKAEAERGTKVYMLLDTAEDALFQILLDEKRHQETTGHLYQQFTRRVG